MMKEEPVTNTRSLWFDILLKFNYSAYNEIEHPRWGVIQGVGTMKPIKVGEEIFTFYDYKRASFPADYPWYHEAQRRIKEEL